MAKLQLKSSECPVSIRTTLPCTRIFRMLDRFEAVSRRFLLISCCNYTHAQTKICRSLLTGLRQTEVIGNCQSAPLEQAFKRRLMKSRNNVNRSERSCVSCRIPGCSRELYLPRTPRVYRGRSIKRYVHRNCTTIPRAVNNDDDIGDIRWQITRQSNR